MKLLTRKLAVVVMTIALTLGMAMSAMANGTSNPSPTGETYQEEDTESSSGSSSKHHHHHSSSSSSKKAPKTGMEETWVLWLAAAGVFAGTYVVTYNRKRG